MRRQHLGSAVIGGVLAGIVSAAFMCLVPILAAAISGKHAWYAPLELAGGLATESAARLEAGMQIETVMFGVVLHFGIGALWGGVFGFGVGSTVHHVFPSEGVVFGIVFGIAVWVVDLLIVRHIDPPTSHAVPLWLGAVTHLGYGGVLGGLFHRLRPHHDEELRHREDLDRERRKLIL